MKIKARGTLGYRLTQSYSRLECEHYLPEVVWTADKSSWPGDWEGRTILALVSLAKTTGKEPSYLEGILDLLPEKLNARGYMGEIYPDGGISEQQLAGNSWLLRGLIEYTKWKQTDRLLPIIEGLVKNLYLPLIDEIDDYPAEKYDKEGTYSGSIIAIRGKWMLSADMGCIFISLDGISAAYELFGWDSLRELLDRMIQKFASVDLFGDMFQTHATLSALRGIIRTYELTKKKEYLDLATDRFALYLQKGQTENYSNTNRFQMEKWTEPCAIIDSYMVAVELYKLTGEISYLDMAQRIYFNSISHAQLPNGGMGLQNCPGFLDQNNLNFTKRDKGYITEAYWCCNMRGGDGLSYVANQHCLKNSNTYTFINFFDCEIEDGDIIMNVKTKYPYEGSVNISVSNRAKKALTLRFYIPDYAETVTVNGVEQAVTDGFASVDVTNSTEIALTFKIPLIHVLCHTAPVKASHYKLMHGMLLLGTQEKITKPDELTYVEKGQYETADHIRFAPVGESIFKDMTTVSNEDFTVLFDKNA